VNVSTQSTEKGKGANVVAQQDLCVDSECPIAAYCLTLTGASVDQDSRVEGGERADAVVDVGDRGGVPGGLAADGDAEWRLDLVFLLQVLIGWSYDEEK
jgi:hypothetical protein